MIAALNESRSTASALLRRLAGGWTALRNICGDDAYERYRAHRILHHADEPMLDRRSFYLDAQQRKWSGVQRCC
jgi:uncharacterized short protein YbdD (DUF466 family)